MSFSRENEIPKIFSKNNVLKPFVNSTGEKVYELTGADKERGLAKNHSVAYVEIPPKCSSRLHYHPIAEETYFIIKGTGRIVMDGKEFEIKPNDTVLISPEVKHQIFAGEYETLEFVVSCAPVWEPTNTVYLDEEK